MSHIIDLTKKVLDLFEESGLTKVQAVLVCETVRLSIFEEITKEIIDDSKKGHDSKHNHLGIF